MMKSNNILYLLLGSNTGDSKTILNTSIDLLRKNVGNIISISSLYQTEPWGNKDQPPFLNQVLKIETALSAQETLQITLNIEKTLGRERFERWAPRTLDIDILYYNTDIIVNQDLKVPHSELHNRKFTLVPLNELDPNFIHPVFNVSNKELLKRCGDESEVKKI